MKKLYLMTLLVLLISIGIYANCATKNVTQIHLPKRSSFIISGKVSQISAYCGGAKPTQEMLDRLAVPTAYPNKKFYIRKGKVNTLKSKSVTSFTTDSTGAFSISLAPGIHSIIVEEQLNEIKPNDFVNKNQRVDEKCLNDWWSKPYYLLEIKNKNIVELNFVFHHQCFITNDIPCIYYTGPLPPAKQY